MCRSANARHSNTDAGIPNAATILETMGLTHARTAAGRATNAPVGQSRGINIVPITADPAPKTIFTEKGGDW